MARKEIAKVLSCSIAASSTQTIWADARFSRTLDHWRVKAGKLATFVGHVNVETVHMLAAFLMRSSIIFAVLDFLLALTSALIKLGLAISKARIHLTIVALLVNNVLINDGILNARHEHVSDGGQSILNVLVELPPRLGDGFFGQ
jgi:hypothetical protein